MAHPGFPPPLAAVLGRLPPYPGSMLFAAALNLVVRPHLPDDVKASLQGRTLRIAVTDARVAFDFTWRQGGFCALPRGAGTDLEIAAGAGDFVALARREEDPDTLFFSRRLVMSGDTELGLLVKNTLDAMDTPLPQSLRAALSHWLRRTTR
ncbi:sterol-binding protein [Duganella sp. FT92W]|uniref:Ubiquinone biosynthesis accessory factor UbiT n=2 Tax=Pseudoduganella rivuli TaxID=2666085 RepID=A0A7X2ILM5_9BURK|nr:sterol-binding protein [Pseudoduganella rivuli]